MTFMCFRETEVESRKKAGEPQSIQTNSITVFLAAQMKRKISFAVVNRKVSFAQTAKLIFHSQSGSIARGRTEIS